MNNVRQLPQSQDAEKAILGSILLDPDRTIGICKQNGATDEWFHNPIHALIFTAALNMADLGKPIDLVTMTAFLEDTRLLHEVGGAAAVTEIFAFVETSTNATYYLEMMREKLALRRLIRACSEYAQRAYDEQDRPIELVSEADAAITLVSQSMARDAVVTRKGLLADYLQEKEDIASGVKVKEMLPSPLDEINKRVGGYSPGEITIIMGPTNSGKSMLGMEHVLLAAFGREMPSAIFTGEMPYRQYVDRIFANRGRISSRNLRSAKLSQGELKSFIAVQTRMAEMPLEIYDSKRNALTLDSIEAQIRILKKKMGLKVVLIDYLQKLNFPRRKDMRRDEEVTMATSVFKSLAVELDLYIFILSATNDDGQVRESRGPEYDADNIISVITDTKTKKTEKVFIPKWRDGEKSYSIDVEIIGDLCQFREKL